MEINAQLDPLTSASVCIPPTLVEASWPGLLEIVPEIGMLELQAMIIARRQPFDQSEWGRIERAIDRHVSRQSFRDVVRDHLWQVATGGQR